LKIWPAGFAQARAYRTWGGREAAATAAHRGAARAVRRATHLPGLTADQSQRDELLRLATTIRPRQNGLAWGKRELGRIARTLFILESGGSSLCQGAEMLVTRRLSPATWAGTPVRDASNWRNMATRKAIRKRRCWRY